MSVNEKMTAIADAIRAKTGGTDKLTLDGMAVGVDEVFAAGEKREYDDFWDGFQQNGSRTFYDYAFSYGWDEKGFAPKYDIKPTSANYMFRNARVEGDLREILNKQGVVLDFGGVGNAFAYCFAGCRFTALPAIDLTGVTATNYTVSGIFGWTSTLRTIDKIIIRDDGSTPFAQWFTATTGIEELTITGKIGQNDFNVQSSTKLSRDSIMSIVNALSTTTTGLSVTLSKAAVNTAFATSAGAANGATSAAWTALANTKSNWTINLV